MILSKAIDKIEEFIKECNKYDFAQPPSFRAVGMLHELKLILQSSESEGVEVEVYDICKGKRYAECKGTVSIKCGCDLVDSMDKCDNCGSNIIWPNNNESKETYIANLKGEQP